VLLVACAPDRATRPEERGNPAILAAHAPGTVMTFAVTNGWDSKDLTTLVGSGKLAQVLTTDLAYYDVEAGNFLSLNFADIPADATVQAVKIRARMFMDPGVGGVALFQIGGGDLTTPSVAMEKAVGATFDGNVSVTWDVTAWARTVARVNDLKLRIRNMDPGADGAVKVDRAWLEVTFGPTPAPVAMNWKVSLFPSDGWDSKDLKLLSLAGTVGDVVVKELLALVDVAELPMVEIVGGQPLSLEFGNIPSDATVQSVKVRVAWINGEPLEPGEPPDPALIGSALLQVGGGELMRPSPVMELHTSIPAGESSVIWDVTAAARTAAQVNALNLIVTNTSAADLGVNQAYLEITYGPTPPPIDIDIPITILATGGWDEQNGEALVEGGGLDDIKTADGNASEVLAGYSLAIDFGNIPPDSTVKSVKLRITSSTDVGFTPGFLFWQAGGGGRSSPFVAMEHRPGLAQTSATWDITPWFRTATRVNNLTLTIRNLDPLGKKVMVDHASLQVTYGPTPPKSTTGFPVTLFVVDGWNSKDSTKTLTTAAGVGIVNAADGRRQAVEGGQVATFRFTRIPGGSTVSAIRIKTRHYEDEGFASGALVFRAGGGSLTSPSVLVRTFPPILSGELNEATRDWGVGGVINTAAKVNDLKFAVKNNDALGKKAYINRVHVTVTHKEP
jgi:hypothetical protein